MIRSCGSTSGEGWLLEASRFIRVSCCTLFVTTRDATHIRADLHVLARTYAAVRDLQVIGGMGLSQAEKAGVGGSTLPLGHHLFKHLQALKTHRVRKCSNSIGRFGGFVSWFTVSRLNKNL